jgi:hypothetical protein
MKIDGIGYESSFVILICTVRTWYFENLFYTKSNTVQEFSARKEEEEESIIIIHHHHPSEFEWNWPCVQECTRTVGTYYR